MENKNIGSETEFDEKRQARRQRRIRSQIIAYVIAAVLALVVIVGGALIAQGIGAAIMKMNQPRADISTEEASVEADQAAATSTENTSTDVAVKETSVLDEIVSNSMRDMSLEDKVAGLFFVAPEQLTGADAVIKAGNATQKALVEYPVGGLYYTSKNIKDEAQLSEMLSSTANMSKYPLFIATAEVGGSMNQVAGALGLEKPKSPSEISATGNPEEAYAAASNVSDYLNRYGFNLNMGVNANLSDMEAAFGTDEDTVSKMVTSTVNGLNEYGILSCLQYYPQMFDEGASMTDILSITGPFVAGVEAGAPMIMVCNASTSGITGSDEPSCFSVAVIEGILREQMRFEGVVITDSLSDGIITDNYSAGEAAVAAIDAGADMIFMPGDFKEAYENVLAAVQNGTISEDRINESIYRIFQVKYADMAKEIEGKQ